MSYDSYRTTLWERIQDNWLLRKVFSIEAVCIAAIAGIFVGGVYLAKDSKRKISEKAVAEALPEWKAIKDNPSRMYVAGENPSTGKWGVAVAPMDYLEMRAKPHMAGTAKECLDFVVAGEAVEKVAGRVTAGAESNAEKAQMVFDYIREDIKEELVDEHSRFPRLHEPKNPNRPMHVRYPLETLVDGGGDNIDAAVLAASLMKSTGMDTMLLHFPADEKHLPYMAVGVSADFSGMPERRRVCFPISGKKFYLFATAGTAGGKRMSYVGQIPDEIRGRNPRVYPVKGNP